jgi:hypothetical protein
VDQAIADLSESASAFVRRVHEGRADDVHAEAEMHLRRLREFVRRTGVNLEQVPAWSRSATSWTAVARIAAADDRRRTRPTVRPRKERSNAG